jgi:hypothetical protein
LNLTVPLKVHEATIREAFDRYQAQQVDISGEPIGCDDRQAGRQASSRQASRTLVTDAFRAGDSVTTGRWIGLEAIIGRAAAKRLAGSRGAKAQDALAFDEAGGVV